MILTMRLAFRNIFRHRTRSVITLSAIAFGGIALIFVGGFFANILHRMREEYIKAHTGHLQVYRKGFVEHGRRTPFDYLIDQPQTIISLVQHIPGVTTVASRLEFSGLLSTGETSVSCLGQGVEPRNEPTTSLAKGLHSKRREPAPSLIIE